MPGRFSRGSSGDGVCPAWAKVPPVPAFIDRAVEAVRATLGLGTTREHVDRLVGAVRTLAGQGPRSEYTESAHGCQPSDDPRDLEAPRIW